MNLSHCHYLFRNAQQSLQVYLKFRSGMYYQTQSTEKVKDLQKVNHKLITGAKTQLHSVLYGQLINTNVNISNFQKHVLVPDVF